MGPLLKSQSEIRADALRRARKRGMANFTEAALILDKSQPTIRAMVDRGEIETLKYGRLHYINLDELEHLKAKL